MSKATYMVDLRYDKPDLVKCENGIFTRYDPRIPEEWKRSEFLDAFSHGGGDYVWYDDIPEEDVEFYKDKIKEFWKKRGKM